jgi:tetratricopeptide (TPR) repeat protein
MILTLALLLASGLNPAPIPVSALPTASLLVEDSDENLSLEALLAHYRERREALFQEMRAEVQTVVAEMESAYELDRRERLLKLRGRLLKLGAEATPLFVEQLDPGTDAEAPAVGRARQMALVMRELSTRSVSVGLIGIFTGGSREGQRNALTALSGSDDPERVGPVLRDAFSDASTRKRGDLITAIANLGGEDNFAFIGEILTHQDSKIVTAALGALTESRCEAAAPRVLDLLHDTVTAAAYVPEIVAYYRACHEVLDTQHIADLVRFASGLRNNSGMAAEVLKLVSEHEGAWNSKVKKDLKELAESTRGSLQQAARICLARAGDRGAKRDLLNDFDEAIERNGRIASNWYKRGEIKYQIADYKGALKDFQQARKTSEEYLRTDSDIYIGMARCHAQLGKPKDAAATLEAGGLSITQLRLLAQEPVFAELAADPKLRKVFRLKEE